MLSVLVRTAVPGYHRLGGFNHTRLFLTALETEQSKIRVAADSVSEDSLLPGSWCPRMAERTL